MGTKEKGKNREQKKKLHVMYFRLGGEGAEMTLLEPRTELITKIGGESPGYLKCLWDGQQMIVRLKDDFFCLRCRDDNAQFGSPNEQFATQAKPLFAAGSRDRERP